MMMLELCQAAKDSRCISAITDDYFWASQLHPTLILPISASTGQRFCPVSRGGDSMQLTNQVHFTLILLAATDRCCRGCICHFHQLRSADALNAVPLKERRR